MGSVNQTFELFFFRCGDLPHTDPCLAGVVSPHHCPELTVTPSLVSDSGSGPGPAGWPLMGHGWPGPHDGGSEAATLQPASPTNRLKRLTNTDSVYTMCQTPEGPKFQCAMCARIFNLKCTLLRHVRHQHQGRFVPHPCKTCGQVFKRTDHLKVHMKKIHNINVVATPSSQQHSPSTTIQPVVVTASKQTT